MGLRPNVKIIKAEGNPARVQHVLAVICHPKTLSAAEVMLTIVEALPRFAQLAHAAAAVDDGVAVSVGATPTRDSTGAAAEAAGLRIAACDCMP